MLEQNDFKNEKTERTYEVNGKKLSEQEFYDLQKDSKVSLKEIAPFVYKKLDRMFG